MDRPTPETVRAASYLAAKQRSDALPAKERRTPKTGRNIKCNPPNKRCGDRCIPPNWNCRVSGGGLDSHSKAVQFDPVGGAGNVIRGVKNVKEGVTKGDPEKVTRGLKGIERGITKLTPGDDLEAKHRFRKNVKNAIAVTAGVTLGFMGARKIHQVLKKSSDLYKNGWGADIDNAANRARQKVLGAVDRLPLIGGRRARALGAAQGAAGQMAVASQRTVLAQKLATTEGATLARVSDRVGLMSDGVRIGEYDAIDTRARAARMGFDEWQREKATALMQLDRPLRGAAGSAGPGSAFSKPAAHEFLAKAYGLELPSKDLRTYSMAGELSSVRTQLKDRFTAMQDDLQEGMRARGLDPANKKHVGDYVEEILKAAPINKQGLNTADARTVHGLASAQLAELIKTKDPGQFSRNVYNEAVKTYDDYFARAARQAQWPAGAKDSMYGDATRAIAKLNASRSGTAEPKSVTHAQFENRYYHHVHVAGNSTTDTRKALGLTKNNAIKVAQDLTGDRSITRPAQAEATLRGLGYNVRVPRTREMFGGGGGAEPAPTPTPSQPRARRTSRNAAGRAPAATSAPAPQPTPTRRAPSRAEQAQRMKVGQEAAAQISFNDAVNRLMKQQGLSRQAAERIVRNRRGDAMPPRIAAYLEMKQRLDAGKGKPCGQSYISAGKECRTKGSPRSSSPEDGKGNAVAANKHDATYRAKQIGSFVARAGLTAGMGALAYDAFRKSKSDPNAFQAGAMLTVGAAIGVSSLMREGRTTHSAKQLADEYEKLKKQPGVEPETVDKLKKFITETEMDSQRVGAMQVLMGLGGYFDSSQPDRIHVIGGGAKVSDAVRDKDPAAAYSKGAARFMEERAKLSESKQNAANMKTVQDMQRHFTGSAFIGNDDGQRQYLLSHEIGHALHYRSNFASPSSVKVDGKVYQADELTRELRRSTSIYGQSDIAKKRSGYDATNYYHQGARLETFSENFALYVANGKKMKELYPVSYAWTKATADYAFAQPPKKAARPFLDVVKDLAADGRPDTLPPAKPRKKQRTDAPEPERFFELYNAMVEAATSGKVREATLILAQAQELPKEQRFMIASLMETAAMYALEPSEAPERGDAAGEKRLGKPAALATSTGATSAPKVAGQLQPPTHPPSPVNAGAPSALH